MNYSNLLSGYTSMNLTKLDILTGLPELKIAVSYSYKATALRQPARLRAAADVPPRSRARR